MNALLQLTKYIGALCALVLCLGFLTRSDLKLMEGQESSIISSLLPTNEATATLDARPTLAAERPARYQNSAIEPLLAEASTERPRTRTAKAVTAADRSSRPQARIDLEAWLDLNVAQTFLEAEKETMSPGVILATGLYFLQEGQGDMSMNAADVATYLSEVRDNADGEAKAHMKYIANSEAWFTGLKKAGFDGEQIAKFFQRFRLNQYDQEMYNRFVAKKAETRNYERPSTTLTDEVDERNRSLAQAYNDYADRPEVRKKLGLPSMRAPRPMAAEELSEGRREALSFTAGESRTYDNPREFWAVLKEMIALEANYDSWEAYQKDRPRRADKEFRERSNIMALGGVMKITRSEGA